MVWVYERGRELTTNQEATWGLDPLITTGSHENSPRRQEFLPGTSPWPYLLMITSISSPPFYTRGQAVSTNTFGRQAICKCFSAWSSNTVDTALSSFSLHCLTHLWTFRIFCARWTDGRSAKAFRGKLGGSVCYNEGVRPSTFFSGELHYESVF